MTTLTTFRIHEKRQKRSSEDAFLRGVIRSDSTERKETKSAKRVKRFNNARAPQWDFKMDLSLARQLAGFCRSERTSSGSFTSHAWSQIEDNLRSEFHVSLPQAFLKVRYYVVRLQCWFIVRVSYLLC